MWNKWNGTRYERMSDNAPDVFDALESFYRNREPERQKGVLEMWD